MPPLVPRKRLRETPPPERQAKKPNGVSGKTASSSERRKPTLYDDLDATSSNHAQSLLQDLAGDDSDSSLTSLSEDEFEDVPPPKRQKNESDDDDEDIEFEDVAAPSAPAPDGPVPTGDLELTLHRDTRISLTNPFGEKKGPSKRERKVRNATHCVHVMTLLWHNATRNAWLCDPEIQATMLSHLSPKLWEQVDRWRRNSGLVKESPKPRPKSTAKGKGKGKSAGKGKKATDEDHRDWGIAAERLEDGAVDMSHGDPLFRLMQYLAPWWRKRFQVDSPGLRKWGYMSLERLDRLTKAHKTEDHDAERFGEQIVDLDDFRRAARECRGSRDVGAQLFTALLRGLGLEARMVANLQVLGFGWNRLEDADPEVEEDDSTAKVEELATKDKTPMKSSTNGTTSKSTKQGKASKPTNRSRVTKSKANEPIIIHDTDSLELERTDTDDESVVELEVRSKRRPPPKKYDGDLEFPHYWTEVMSPVTKKYLPVEPIAKCVIATNRELTESLEPRGAKADRARQIMAYIVGHSEDGTAKDVTVRYLKRQTLPGRTKGARMPLEKVPIHGRNGKIKRYEHFDWFKTAMSAYKRGTKMHPVTEIDEEEESTDLKPALVEKKQVKEGEETLQYYKQSKEFALERHLRREEALKPGVKPVNVFKNKAKGGKMDEEDVYLRSDVLNVKSAETWHKQGRAPLPGEQPLKRVPYRAATTNRRREIMEAEAATGRKVLQGLFSFDQTEWIIPPPIQDGVIPKNDYGNIDLFAEHMCPKGAVHVPFRGVVKVCKRLQIDYAEAVVDFEFGHRMAVPVIQGVVIAEEHHDHVMVELEKDEAERVRKEDEKRRKAALGKWRKFLMGMRIVQRIRQDYGDIDDKVSVFGHSNVNPLTEDKAPGTVEEEDMAGGFLPEGYVEEEPEGAETENQRSSFFPVTNEEDGDEGHDDDLVMEDHRLEATEVHKLPVATAAEAAAAPPSAIRRKVGRPAKAVRKSPSPSPSPSPASDEDASPPSSSGSGKRAAPTAKSRSTGTRQSTRQKRQRVVLDEDDDDDEDDESHATAGNDDSGSEY